MLYIVTQIGNRNATICESAKQVASLCDCSASYVYSALKHKNGLLKDFVIQRAKECSREQLSKVKVTPGKAEPSPLVKAAPRKRRGRGKRIKMVGKNSFELE